jgi:Flp pilus assembly protein TadG
MSVRDERGSASVWMVTASFAMSVLVGLAVDLGGQVHAQQRAHDIAAQAARTGAEEVQAAPAIEGRFAHIDAAAAGRAALGYLAQSDVKGTVRVRGDQINVRVTDTYQTVFLGLIGINRVRVHGDADAHVVRTLGGDQR